MTIGKGALESPDGAACTWVEPFNHPAGARTAAMVAETGAEPCTGTTGESGGFSALTTGATPAVDAAGAAGPIGCGGGDGCAGNGCGACGACVARALALALGGDGSGGFGSVDGG